MKSRILTATLALSLLFVLPAQAATKSIKIANLPILASGSFFQGKGGQWFDTLISKRAIYLVGTSEPSTGPTQGEVIALSPITGAQMWDLPIPGNFDAVASAATLDAAGNLWVAGSTSVPVATPTPTPTPTSSPPGVVNPGGVVVTPVPPTRAGLTHITVWEINPDGSLITTFTYNAPDVLLPSTIAFVKSSLVITGNDFQVTMSKVGVFSKFISASFAIKKAATSSSLKDGLYIWKSYVAHGLIAGVSGVKSTDVNRVLLKVGSRTGTIYGAYRIAGLQLKFDYLAGVGVVLTTSTPTGYAISVLK